MTKAAAALSRIDLFKEWRKQGRTSWPPGRIPWHVDWQRRAVGTGGSVAAIRRAASCRRVVPTCARPGSRFRSNRFGSGGCCRGGPRACGRLTSVGTSGPGDRNSLSRGVSSRHTRAGPNRTFVRGQIPPHARGGATSRLRRSVDGTGCFCSTSGSAETWESSSAMPTSGPTHGFRKTGAAFLPSSLQRHAPCSISWWMDATSLGIS
jgi:hypothetical protein